MLECPMHWGGPILSGDDLKRVEGNLPEEPTPWGQVVTKIFLAWSELQRHNPERARQLMVECYMMLLPDDAFDPGCPVLREYRAGVKHVVDSMWGTAKSAHCVNNPAGPDYTGSVGAFLRTITPYDALDNKQKSAVEAIRAQLGPVQDCVSSISKAIKLNPTEGQWHCWLGKYMLSERRLQGRLGRTACGNCADGTVGLNPIPDIAELEVLRKALTLRRNPESCGLVASCLMDSIVGFTAGVALLNQALVEFPESVYLQHLEEDVYGAIESSATRVAGRAAGQRERERFKKLLPAGDLGSPMATETNYAKKRGKKKQVKFI